MPLNSNEESEKDFVPASDREGDGGSRRLASPGNSRASRGRGRWVGSNVRDNLGRSGRNVGNRGHDITEAHHGISDSSGLRNHLNPARDGNCGRGYIKHGRETDGCVGRQGRGRGRFFEYDVAGRRSSRSESTAGRSKRIAAPSTKTTSLTNVLLAEPSAKFMFYLYSVDVFDRGGNKIESASRCNQLLLFGIFEKLLKDMPVGDKESRKRMTFFSGNFFFSPSRIPGLENLPLTLLDGSETDLETVSVRRVQCFAAPSELQVGSESENTLENTVSVDFRCSDCTMSFVDCNGCTRHCLASGHSPVTMDAEATPASLRVYSQYANMIVKRAMGERMARWGEHFVDPQSFVTPRRKNGQEMGVHIFQAYHVEFNVGRSLPGGPPTLMLTIDLTAKVIRTKGILHSLCRGRDPTTYIFSENEKRAAKERWIGQQVISKLDKTAYSIQDLLFEASSDSLPVADLGMSHTTYYKERKNVILEFPAARPMIAVLGRNKRIIHLPPEIVCANELDDDVRSQLPQIASIKPDRRNDAIEAAKRFLIPGAQKSKGMSGLLPALGIVLSDTRLSAQAEVLPLPMMLSCGQRINETLGKSTWAPQIAKATFDVNPHKAVILNVIVIHHHSIDWEQSYRSIASMVNKRKSVFRFPDRPVKVISALDDMERHWRAVATHFGGTERLPPNRKFGWDAV